MAAEKFDVNQDANSGPASTTPTVTEPSASGSSAAKKIFIGPYGLRAGWRLAIFALIVMALSLAVRIIARAFGAQPGRQTLTSLTPIGVSIFAGSGFLLFLVATLIMAKIEGRKFGQYGLPWSQAFRGDFWVGLAWGFLTTSGTLLAIYALHGVHVTRGPIHAGAIPAVVAGWAVAFLFVGLNEEFSFRGYLQFTLTTGIGFWPSAIVFSALFGLAHAKNSGETVLGESSVVLFGLLFCLFLRRTGNLWWPVGFHMGYDWGETFFYGVPDSGLLPTHNLFSSSFSGPRWLTGGTAGPEASIFCPIALIVVAILFNLKYREVRYRTGP